MRPFLVCLIAGLGCTPPPKVCNGHESLCDVPFDEVVFAVSHNAMSNADDGWSLPNQQWTLRRQLDEGVRGFMLDTYNEGDEVLLCHGVCVAGSIPLDQALRVFVEFLEENPGEVLTFMIQPGASTETTAATFERADAVPITRVQSVGEPWPTLGELIAADERMVVFHEGGDDSVPWYMPGYAHYVWDTDYAAKTPDDFSCDALRGSPDHSIYLMNHFLTNPVASTRWADMVNVDPLLSDRIAQCEEEAGQQVDWIAVDFIDRGDVLDVVHALNAHR